MASDADYAAFLDKANQDTSGTGTGTATAMSSSNKKTTKGFASTKAVDTVVPTALQGIEQVYVSDTDEPFEAVALKWEGETLPDDEQFRDLVGHDEADVEIMSIDEFDPRGMYADVVGAVQTAAAGDAKAGAKAEEGHGTARVYRVAHEGSRVEYYVVALDRAQHRIVGVKARAVES